MEEIETREQRTVRRKEKERLKDEIMLDLLPRAFSRHRLDRAYFEPAAGGGWLAYGNSVKMAVCTALIGSVLIFTGAYLMTNGGPQNSTLFAVLYLYRLAFEQFNMGLASAFAWLLFFVILGFTLIQLRLSRSWVYYEGGEA